VNGVDWDAGARDAFPQALGPRLPGPWHDEVGTLFGPGADQAHKLTTYRKCARPAASDFISARESRGAAVAWGGDYLGIRGRTNRR